MQNPLFVKYSIRCIAQNLISQADSVCFATRHLSFSPYYPPCWMNTVIMLLEHNLFGRKSMVFYYVVTLFHYFKEIAVYH